MTTSREISATGPCRDLRNPVGNDSIDPYVCEYMAPTPDVYTALALLVTPAFVVEYIATTLAKSYMAPAPVVYAASVPVVKYIAPVPAMSYAAPVQPCALRQHQCTSRQRWP